MAANTKTMVGRGEKTDRYFQPEVETAPAERIREIQLKRILELVPYAWENSAFYRERWSAAGVKPESINSIEEFVAAVPTFTKDDLRAYRARTGDPSPGCFVCLPTR